jgi:hypothetical protein
MEIISKLVNWFGFSSPKKCQMCDAYLDKDYGEIVYMPADSQDFFTMKVCSGCISALEESHKQTRQFIEEWKKHDSL